MRNLMALLFLMSLCSLQLVFSAQTSLDTMLCCEGTSTMKIPVKNIVRYWWTSSDCPSKAIVFETFNKKTNVEKKFCLDPTAAWVSKYLNEEEMRNKSPMDQQTSETQQ
ncbi:C-C motif chemokine 18-like [Tachysurus fulvidraco]|uniref:C-C motif chemokine 18-like n=1 Tax=Tachysurus fulvidraco TaxID=1234273 RepID=UPI001FEEFC64|nr:C-C motif chemokine 18-like [Tachysurus fulvidraco]